MVEERIGPEAALLLAPDGRTARLVFAAGFTTLPERKGFPKNYFASMSFFVWTKVFPEPPEGSAACMQ
jgi:hypothetical protein